MLNGVDEIDWGSLEDAYGPTVEMPARLRALASGSEEWRDALDQLYGGIFHQGSYYPATAPAARFLCELAVEPSVPTRAPILDLLAELSGAHRNDTAQGWDPFTFRSDPAPPEYAEAVATIEVIEAAAGRFVPLLTDEAASVRETAARLLGGLVADPPGQKKALLDALAREEDPVVAASFVVAAARLSDESEPTPWLDEIAARMDTELVRGAVAVARATLGEADLEALEAAALFDPGDAETSWIEEQLAPLAVTALGRAEGAIEPLRRITDEWLERYGPLFDFHSRNDWAGDAHHPSPAQWRRDELVRASAAMVCRSVFQEHLDREEPLMRDELDDAQRAVLSWTLDYGLPIPVRAIPWVRARDMARFLEGNGGLDTVVGEEPLWVALHRVSALDGLRGRDDAEARANAAFESVLGALASLSAEVVFDICRDVLAHAYPHPAAWGYCVRPPRHDALLAILEPHHDALTDRFAALRASLLEESDEVDAPLARFAVADLDLDADIDPRLDDLLSLALAGDEEGAPQVLTALPIDRRSRIVGRMPGRRGPLLDLADREIVARESIDAFLEEEWTLTWFMTWERLMELGDDLLTPARDALEHATGRKRDLLIRLLDELEGKIDDVELEITIDGELLRARLLGGGDEHLVALPPIPERDDLAPIVEAFDDPGTIRLTVKTDDAIDHTLGYRLQRLLADLGFHTVTLGSSSITRR